MEEAKCCKEKREVPFRSTQGVYDFIIRTASVILFLPSLPRAAT